MNEKISMRYKAILIVILFISENFFYILDKGALSISGVINMDDLVVLLSIVLALCIYNFKKNELVEYKFSSGYKFILLFLIFLMMMSIKTSKDLYGQPVTSACLCQRFLLLYFMYFPFKRIFIHKEEYIKKTKEIIMAFGAIESILYTIQYFLFEKIKFLQIVKDLRFGEVRLHFEGFAIFISYYFYLDRALKQRKKKDIAIVISELFYLIVVLKGRLTIIAIISSTLLICFLQKKGKLLMIYMLIAVSIATMCTKDNIIIQTYNSIFEEVSSGSGNYKVREKGKEFYRKKLKGRMLTGNGNVNRNFAKAKKERGIDKGYLFVDNGLMGIIFLYGEIGAAWTIIMYLLIIKKGITIFRRSGDTAYLGIGLYLILTLINIPYTLMLVYPIYFAILFAFTDVESFKLLKGQGKETNSVLGGDYGERWYNNIELQ